MIVHELRHKLTGRYGTRRVVLANDILGDFVELEWLGEHEVDGQMCIVLGVKD